MMERRNTPSPLYLSVTFLAREMRSARYEPGSSCNRSASSNVMGSSFTRSFSDTTPRMEIVSPPLEQFWLLDYRNGVCCQQLVRTDQGPGAGGQRDWIILVIVKTFAQPSVKIVSREGFFELLKVYNCHHLHVASGIFYPFLFRITTALELHSSR